MLVRSARDPGVSSDKISRSFSERFGGIDDDAGAFESHASGVRFASPSAALKALLNHEPDGDEPVTSIMLIDLQSICGSPIGTTGLKSCRHLAVGTGAAYFVQIFGAIEVHSQLARRRGAGNATCP